MKVKTESRIAITVSYPCLGIFPSGIIVLFHSPSKGICIENNDNAAYKIGHYAENWSNDWELFEGEITLSNY